jgi:hypothetical protein
MNTSQYTTYAPTVAEILTVADSAKRRHPDMSARIDKATALLLDGSVQLDTTAWEVRNVARWRVASQSGKGAYVVVGLACPCKDRQCNGVSHCKHAAAVALYTKILTNKLNADIRSFNVELGILENGEFHGYAKGAGYMQIRKLGAGVYTFADAASIVRYAIWLAAKPVAVEWPTVAAVAA